jgi:glucosamine-6-phosphate deaminase
VNCEVFPSEAELAGALARRLADAIATSSHLVLGLPTGRTPLALYAELVALTRARSLDWSRTWTFNLDEFVGLGPKDPRSYRTFMEERLFRHTNIPAEHVGFLDGCAHDLDLECERFERAIRAAGGIDLLVLGIGANGHVAFNEPSESLRARTHRATLTEHTRAGNALWFDGDLWRVPREGLTMGMATILDAKQIVLIATGEAKADAISGMLEGPITTRLPASFLQLHQAVSVALDQPAATEAENCSAATRR